MAYKINKLMLSLLILLISFAIFSKFLLFATATSARYARNYDDQVAEDTLLVNDDTYGDMINRKIVYNLDEGPLLVRGVNFKYITIGSGPFEIGIDFVGYSSYVEYIDNTIPSVSINSWRTFYCAGPVYLIHEKPQIDFIGRNPSNNCIQLCADQPSIGNSYYNTGSGWFQDNLYEYIVELIYERIPKLNHGEIAFGEINTTDNIDAYIVELTANELYEFDLNRESGSGNFTMRLISFQELTNDNLIESSELDWPKTLVYTPEKSQKYVLLVEAEDPFSDCGIYSITFYHQNNERIVIESNKGFNSKNGVINSWADGTESDPYIISNKVFDKCEIGTCIEIRDTTKFFRIEDCEFSNATNAIKLYNLSNGVIRNNAISQFVGTNGSVSNINGENLCIFNFTDCINILSNNNSISSISAGSGYNGLNGADGINQGDDGGQGNNAGEGGNISIYYIKNSNKIDISSNSISRIFGGYGGNGGNGGDGGGDNSFENGGTGGYGGSGGNGGSIIIFEGFISNNIIIKNNFISNIFSGSGGNGGSGGDGADGMGNGGYAGIPGNGGNITILSLIDISSLDYEENYIYNLTSGNGGLGNLGGNYGTGTMGSHGSPGWSSYGGDGGAILISNLIDSNLITIIKNNFTDVLSGNGGDGGYYGGSGGNSGQIKIARFHLSQDLTFSHNNISSISTGTPGIGCHGRPEGYFSFTSSGSAGNIKGLEFISCNNISCLNNYFIEFEGSNGADGENGFQYAEGVNGGKGTDIFGIFTLNSSKLILNNNYISTFRSGNGGYGGNYGGEYNSWAGDGGDAGNLYGFLFDQTTEVIMNNTYVSNFDAGHGGRAGHSISDYDRNEGGSGGKSIFMECFEGNEFSIHNNYINDLQGGYGGSGEEEDGEDGKGYGIIFDNSSINLNIIGFISNWNNTNLDEDYLIWNIDDNLLPNNDTDRDQLQDIWELQYGLDPLYPDQDLDNDNDGLSNLEEFQYNTNPIKNDTDDDRLNDYEEIKLYNTDPLNADTDGDGWSDGDEVLVYDTDPLNPNDHPNSGMSQIILGYSLYLVLLSITLISIVWFIKIKRRYSTK
ncbi:MAG: hypothetical protein ACFFDH_09690 [Promethearchaeota archaeon]